MRLELGKGLAASAVGALAVTGLTVGLPAAPASAVGEGVVLVSLFNQGHDASVRWDGTDRAIGLVALRLNPAATISFEYNPNPTATDATPGWVTLAGGLTSDIGDYTNYTWIPGPSLVGTTVAVRAVATVAGTPTYSTRQGVAITASVGDPNSVSLDTTSIGFFDQPYASTGRTATRAAVTGFTSATDGTAQLSWWRASDQTFQGQVNAQVEPYQLKVFDAPSPNTYVAGGTFSGDLDITAFDADAGDVIAFGAELESDDVQPATLYAQTVGSVSAVAQQVPAGQPTTVTVTVVDTTSSPSAKPIAGAEVRRSGDGSLVGYTDGAGQVRDVQTSGSLGSYYANTTDNDAFEAGTDVSTAVSTYAPSATYAQLHSEDGRAFDDDEYAAGDLYLQVSDQNRAPMPAGATASYRIYPSSAAPPATYETATTDSHGRAPLGFAPQGPDGGYTIDYHVSTQTDATFTFTAGDSVLTVAPPAGVAGPGGQIAVNGSLNVAGKPLAGRRVAVTYTRGVELVPGNTADAGLVDGANLTLSKTVTTDASGAFSFIVDDPVEKPQGAEPGGKLALSTLAAAGGALTGNPNESASATTEFGSTKGKVKIALKGSSAGAKDKLVVKAPDSVAGETVKFFRVVNGKLVSIKSRKLDKKGDAALKVADTNGSGTTTYVVKLVASDRVKGAKSKKLPLE
jgi:hypothetical protein